MPGQLNHIIGRLHSAFVERDGARLTDGQLLARLIEHRDEAAVAALVRRHERMVWGVCRRILSNHHDAEDAFQATFLVLIRKAESIRQKELVGNWLYGVARQTATKMKTILARRGSWEKPLADMAEIEAPAREAGRDWHAVLDQELSHLPAKYRRAIIMCDLHGKTRREAARQLDLPEGTLAGRLTRGRALLARRLARHGARLSASALTAELAKNAASAAPVSVMNSTIKAAALAAAGQAVTGTLSVQVAALTEGVLQAMFLSKIKTMAAWFLFVCILGAGLAATTVAGQDQAGDKPATRRTAAGAADDTAAKDEKLRNLERRLRELEKSNQELIKELNELQSMKKASNAAVPPSVAKEPPAPVVKAPSAPRIEVQIFNLRNHTPADEVVKVLEKFFAFYGASIASLPSTNSIIVQGPPRSVDAIAAMIQRIEEHVDKHRAAQKRAGSPRDDKKEAPSKVGQ